MKKLVIVLLVLLTSIHAGAQTKPKFVSQQLVGLLEGESGSAFQIQTINGFQVKKWFMGVGAGIDWYGYRSVPLFLSMNYDLKLSNRTFFFSFDGGVNLPWTGTKNPGFTGPVDADFRTGLFTNSGIGYKLRLKNSKDGFIINLGFSTKRMFEEQRISNFCPGGNCQITVEKYDYRFRRLSIRVGWLF